MEEAKTDIYSGVIVVNLPHALNAEHNWILGCYVSRKVSFEELKFN
jgi:hypothetical protein